MNKSTVPELKQMCRDKGIKGYSKLNKADLIKLCNSTKKVSKKGSDLTVPELKQLCRDKGITGYSKLNKAELIKKCKADTRRASKRASKRVSWSDDLEDIVNF